MSQVEYKCKIFSSVPPPIIRHIGRERLDIVLYGKKGYIGVVYILCNDSDMISYYDIESCFNIFKVVLDDKTMDYSKRLTINHLLSGTSYSYIIFYSKEKYWPSILENPEYALSKKTYRGHFKTLGVRHSQDNRYSYTFAFGSCRYFLSFLGRKGIGVKKSDRPFKIINRLRDLYDIRSLYLIGDNIYTDIIKYLPCIRVTSKKRLKKIHTAARSTKGFKTLSSSIEIKEIPDDHEYRDNGDPIMGLHDKKAYNNAIRAINIYETSNGPFPPHMSSKMKFWFSTFKEGIPIFGLDTRYERYIDDEGTKRMISRDQMTTLKHKLINYKRKYTDVPFIIFSPVPFAIQHNEDSFYGFPQEQQEIVEFIYDNNIQNVFFLTGDAHCSVSAPFNIVKGNRISNIRIVEILCSGIYQYAHDSRKTFKNKLRIKNSPFSLQSTKSKEQIREEVIKKSAFCVIEYCKIKKRLCVRFFNSKKAVMLREEEYPLLDVKIKKKIKE